MSLEQESYLLCWQAEMSARRLRSALGALRNVHDDFRPCQEVHDAIADYLRSAERAASERGRHYKWLTGGKKYTSPRATQACTKCGASFPSGCCDCEAGDDCPLCGDCCDAALAYCTDCDSPCEGGECDPPHLCRKHGACPKCNPDI